jgi:hypothetical protein
MFFAAKTFLEISKSCASNSGRQLSSVGSMPSLIGGRVGKVDETGDIKKEGRFLMLGKGSFTNI